MKIIKNQAGTFRHYQTNHALTLLVLSVVVLSIAGIFIFSRTNFLNAQPASPQISPQDSISVTLSGTLHMYLVTNYGEKMQEVDHYRKTGEGAFIAFVLKMDKAIDMTQYLSQEEVEFLLDVDTTMQSEFMLVPDWEVFESFSGKDFAAQYAHKRVRVTGTLLCPMAGWRNITLVRMDFSKVEVIE